MFIAALAAVALVLEFVNWAFGAEDIDTFRVLLAVAFVVLFGAGASLAGRTGTVLVAAAGVTAIAGYYAAGISLLFGSGAALGWGWELITLLEGIALAVYASVRLEPGPAYLAFFVLLLFATSAAVIGREEVIAIDGEESPGPDATLLGWPLVLALATVAAAAAGWRRQMAARS